MTQLTGEQWGAMRALCEGATVTYARLATLAAVHMTTISNRARRENWNKLDYRRRVVVDAQRDMVRVGHATAEGAAAAEIDMATERPDGETPAERLLRLIDLVSRQIEHALETAAARGGVLSRIEADNMLTTLKLAERLRDVAPVMTAATPDERQVTSDDDIAGLMSRIDERIIELAEAEAARLVEGQPGDGAA